MSDSRDLAPAEARQLLARAREARTRAYAPYSNFPVGAALLAENGEVYTGCNVENASYGLTLCAERVAVGKAVSEGARGFRAIAVVGPGDLSACPPCGSCRQVLHELGATLQVITATGDELHVSTIGELLPGAFESSRLAAER